MNHYFIKTVLFSAFFTISISTFCNPIETTQNYNECYNDALYDFNNKNYNNTYLKLQNCIKLGDNRGFSIIGSMYLYGQGVDKNIDMALQWFKRGVSRGDYKSAEFLGVIYSKDVYLKSDIPQSIYWFQQIPLEKQSLLIQKKLAMHLFEGFYIEKNLEESFKFFNLAAKKGDIQSTHYLGYMTENGLGTEKSTEFAIKYYEVAAKAGYLDSIKRIQHLKYPVFDKAPIANQSANVQIIELTNKKSSNLINNIGEIIFTFMLCYLLYKVFLILFLKSSTSQKSTIDNKTQSPSNFVSNTPFNIPNQNIKIDVLGNPINLSNSTSNVVTNQPIISTSSYPQKKSSFIKQ